MSWLHFLALILIVAFDVAVVLFWNNYAPWIPRPKEGYVWEHSLASWAEIQAEKDKPQKLWVYGWVNRYDPKTGRRWEEQEWIIEPFQD